jgi:hypothetical protein
MADNERAPEGEVAATADKPKRKPAAKKAADAPADDAPQAIPYPDPQNIDQAKLNIMAAVPYLLKTGTAGKGDYKYKYASEREFIRLIRPHMLANRVTVAPIRAQLVDDKGYVGGERAMRACRVHMTYRFKHVPSGTFEDAEMIGEGADIGDKSAGKANTAAYKWAVRQWLMIETGDDPDRVASEDLHAGAGANGRPQKEESPAKAKDKKDEPIKRALDAVGRCASVAALRSLLGTAAEHFGDKSPEYKQVKDAAVAKKTALEKAEKEKKAAADLEGGGADEPNF